MIRARFAEIVDGYLLIDSFDDITDRIERLAEWAKANGPLTFDEHRTVAFMIEIQIARAKKEGIV